MTFSPLITIQWKGSLYSALLCFFYFVFPFFFFFNFYIFFFFFFSKMISILVNDFLFISSHFAFGYLVSSRSLRFICFLVLISLLSAVMLAQSSHSAAVYKDHSDVLKGLFYSNKAKNLELYDAALNYIQSNQVKISKCSVFQFGATNWSYMAQ